MRLMVGKNGEESVANVRLWPVYGTDAVKQLDPDEYQHYPFMM